jgi:hypothetical protein
MGKESKNDIMNFTQAVFGNYFGILFDEGGHTCNGNWFCCAYFIPLSLMELFFGEIQQTAVRFASIK